MREIARCEWHGGVRKEISGFCPGSIEVEPVGGGVKGGRGEREGKDR